MSKNVQRTAKHRGIRRMVVGLAVLTTGITYLNIPSCQGLLTTVNPCGTVFSFCTAEELAATLSNTPNYNLDPTCSIPFFGVNQGTAGVAGTCGTVNVFGNANVPQGGV